MVCSVVQIVLNKWVTDGRRIRWPFVWLFSYVALSAGYCVVRVNKQLHTGIALQLQSLPGMRKNGSCSTLDSLCLTAHFTQIAAVMGTSVQSSGHRPEQWSPCCL